jgi:hypothetical protein
MSSKIAYISVMHGLRGCYMPDYNHPCRFRTRRELASYIRSELSSLDQPASKFAEFEIKKVWSYIQKHGSSKLQVIVPTMPGHALELAGLTRKEWLEAEATDN